MGAEQPEVSRLRSRQRRLAQRRQNVLFVAAGAVQSDVNFAHLEAAHLEIDFAANLHDVQELQAESIEIPARILAQPVEREPQHP